MTLNERLVQQVLQWVGVPYQHRGLTRAGCDCTGLLIGCVQELGYAPNYQLRYYPRDWNLHAMADDYIRQELAAVAAPTPIAQPGDILLFRFGKCVAHSAILVRAKTFLHAHTRAGKVEYGSLLTVQWAKRLAEVWRLDPEKLEAYR